MPKHRDRRATLHWTKIGPPLRGVALCRSLEGVTTLARAISPRLRAVPTQQTAQGNHDVQRWSSSGLIQGRRP